MVLKNFFKKNNKANTKNSKVDTKNLNFKSNNISLKQKAKVFTKKHLLILFTFVGVGLTPLLAFIPTNNTTPFNTNSFREITSENVTSTTLYEGLSLVNIPYANLIRGTTNYNNGNYVLYLGTLSCPDCNNFLLGISNAKDEYDFGSGIGQQKWSSGKWGQGIEWAKTQPGMENLKFVMFEDFPPNSLGVPRNDNLWTLPWRTFESTNFENGEIAGKYIRYDESAIAFRNIFDFAQSIYPQVTGTPTVMYFKNGNVSFFTSDVNSSDPGQNTNTSPSSGVNFKNQLKLLYGTN